MNRRHVGLHVRILAIPSVLLAVFGEHRPLTEIGRAANVEVLLRSPR